MRTFVSLHRFRAVLLVLALVGLWVGNAQAQAPAGGQAQGLAAVGPIDPRHGFPKYYTDKNGLQLEPCLIYPVAVPGDPLTVGGDPCGLTGTIPSGDQTAILFPTNFPTELFYSRVLARLPISGDPGLAQKGGQFTVAMQLEGAFPVGPAAGQQIVFARLRWSLLGGLLPSTQYKLIHPYGVNFFTTDATGAVPKNEGVNDQGCIIPSCAPFNQVLNQTNIGPFLVWDPTGPAGPAPAGFVGDPAAATTILGSPYGTNYVRIEGPRVGGIDAQGNDINFVQTNLFNVWGKLYVPNQFPPSLLIDRTSYARTAAETMINVFGRTEPGSTVTASVAGQIHTMTVDATGRFFSRFPSTALPGDTVEITATNAAGPTVQTSVLTDDVFIDSAAFNPVNGGLLVTAHSSDTLAGAVVLTAETPEPSAPVALGTLVNGSLGIATQVPPHSVAVYSNMGGTAYRLIDSNPAAGTVVAATFTTINASVATAQVGQTVTLTATVTGAAAGVTPGGTVTFKNGAALVGIGTLNASGVATIPFTVQPAGTLSFTATYGGDANFSGSVSGVAPVVVTKASATISITASATAVTTGQAVTFRATVAGVAGVAIPTGTVTFLNGTTVLGTGTLSAGVATLTITPAAVATLQVNARYDGPDPNYTTGGFAATGVTVTVSRPATQISLVPTPATVARGGRMTIAVSVTPVAPATGTVTGTVTVSFAGPTGSTAVAPVTVTLVNGAGTATFNAPRRVAQDAGTWTITANYAGSTGFAASTRVLTVTVTP